MSAQHVFEPVECYWTPSAGEELRTLSLCAYCGLDAASKGREDTCPITIHSFHGPQSSCTECEEW